MISDEPKHVIVELLDIANVEDNDEVFEVRFECGNCGRCFDTVPPEAARGFLLNIFQDRCQKCLSPTGFEYAGNRAENPDELKKLADMLAENPKHPTQQTRAGISQLLAARNLRLRFTVKRPKPDIQQEGVTSR